MELSRRELLVTMAAALTAATTPSPASSLSSTSDVGGISDGASVAPPRPFTVNVPSAILKKISQKLVLAEVSYAPAGGDPWLYGTSADYLRSFLTYWRTAYSWRSSEQLLNKFPQFKAQIEDIDVHFYHVRGSGKSKRALILTHGWPGSPVEFLAVIDRLAYPEQYGGSADDGLDVVVPSLPGFGFSSRPASPIGPRRVAHLWRRLMIDSLGYRRFGAQGGDWGSAVTYWLGCDHADVVSAVHFNLFSGPAEKPDESPEARAWRARLAEVRTREYGYAHEQSTRPQTIGLALSDSPLAFAAWVLEKFQRWGDTHGNIESRFSKDELITNIMTYLVNDSVTSAIWFYYGVEQEGPRYVTPVAVPAGLALFPAEFLPIAPRSVVETVLDVKRWTVMPAGGHFAALEEPEAFADEVRRFFVEFMH